VQERSEEAAAALQLTVAGKKQMCTDGVTPSKLGCSVEECDGGNMCDENCLLLQCGNGIRQKDEQCDDGNLVSKDGCDATCKAEFMCGDSKLDDKFGEQCDPPNSGKVCSMAEFTTSPTSCGCGSTCEYKVCGNGVVQEGEDCDPPNGTTCAADCKRAGISECMQCILLVTNDCGKPLMEGIPGMPGFDKGCLNDKACFDLLQCTLDSRCGLGLPLRCFCGPEQADLDMCESPDFSPKGQCKVQTRDAFISQFGMPPGQNLDVIGSYYDLNPPTGGQSLSLGIAQTLADCTLYVTGGLAGNLQSSGASAQTVTRCLAACGLN
jgi:cysteine-rich repeat protein